MCVRVCVCVTRAARVCDFPKKIQDTHLTDAYHTVHDAHANNVLCVPHDDAITSLSGRIAALELSMFTNQTIPSKTQVPLMLFCC